MQLSEIMTSDPVVLGPDTTLREAAQKMRDLDSGVMPVGENDRLVGMLTDRDITVRATADGKDPNTTPVRNVMTSDVVYCLRAPSADQHDCRLSPATVSRLEPSGLAS